MGLFADTGPAPTPTPVPWSDLIATYAERYDRPCILRETNLRGFPGDRATWLKYTLEQCEIAVAAGVRLDGYADDFSADFDGDQWFGINVFLRDGDQTYRSYCTTSQGAQDLSRIWALLDIAPFGRQETWQDAPEACRRPG